MRRVLYLLLAFAFITLIAAGHCRAEEKWQGVDEAVVEKCAAECGRPATGCLLDLEGDALLFAFLLAGTAGGFVMGYFYRGLSAGAGKGKREEGD